MVFRLANAKAQGAKDDEWMYQLKDEEDDCKFGLINAAFNRLCDGDTADAARLFGKMDHDTTASSVSQLALLNFRRLIKK